VVDDDDDDRTCNLFNCTFELLEQKFLNASELLSSGGCCCWTINISTVHD